jgi:DNA-binding SARP family transcriptional activator
LPTRPPTALLYAVSALILAGVVITTAAFGLGVRIAYGSGMDARLGGQVERDFLADQDAEATALTNSDPSALSSRLTGNALEDVSQQISDQTAAGAALTVNFQPGSLTILRAQDPIDPSLVIEVREDGTKTVTASAGPNSAPTQQTINFHGDFWLRKDPSGRYLIADLKIQNQPSSNLPVLALMAVAVAWIALAAILVKRQHPRPIPSPAADGLAAALAAVAEAPPDYEPIEASADPPAQVVIRTYGGLQMHQDGQDWAAALRARPVTAFIWLRLLLAAVRDPNARPSRDELGRQATPGLDRETQLKRMRNVIYQGLRELPPALSDRVLVEPQVMSFRLEGCEIDAINLLRVCAECAGRSLLAPSQTARARRAVDATAGVFLPEFESVEEIATDRHPTCTDLIREQRDLLAAKRLGLILLLADSYLAAGRPAEAIAVLEPAFQEQPVRDDLRARLAAAYSQAGRKPEAASLEAKQGSGSAIDAVTVRPL